MARSGNATAGLPQARLCVRIGRQTGPSGRSATRRPGLCQQSQSLAACLPRVRSIFDIVGRAGWLRSPERAVCRCHTKNFNAAGVARLGLVALLTKIPFEFSRNPVKGQKLFHHHHLPTILASLFLLPLASFYFSFFAPFPF